MDFEWECENISNSTTGEAECQSTLYIQILGTIIFFVVWPFIVLDMPFFPIGRPAAALIGALLMVVFNVVNQTQVYTIEGEKGNLQTLYLLIGMMLLSYYFDREGLLTIVSLKIFGRSTNSSFRSILWKVCIVTALLSAFITNDAACVLITPLILEQFNKQGRNRKELLPLTLGIATSANIGSAATVFGNPQNSFIASNADVALIDFIIAELPAAVLGVLVNIGLLYLFNFRIIFGKEKPPVTNGTTDIELETNLQKIEHVNFHNGSLTLQKAISERSNDYDKSENPNQTSRIAVEREKLYSESIVRSQSCTSLRGLRNPSSSPLQDSPNNNNQSHVADLPDDNINNLLPIRERSVRQKLFLVWLVFISVFLVLLLAVPPPPTVPDYIRFNLGLVPIAAAVLTMFVDTILNKKFGNDAMQKIDWTVILLFMGLFVWIQGFQNTCFPKYIFDLLKPFMNLNTVEGVLLFTVFVTFGSNIFSNVPLVIIIVDELDELCGEEKCESTKIGGLLLAWVSTVAGNLTLIGSIANLLVAEKARGSAIEYRLTFWKYLRFGFISTLIITFMSLPLVYFLGVGASKI